MDNPTRSEEKALRRQWTAGEKARLWWNGFPQVPRYMSDWLVTIASGPRGGSPRTLPTYRVLTHDGETRTVRCDQLIEVDAGPAQHTIIFSPRNRLC